MRTICPAWALRITLLRSRRLPEGALSAALLRPRLLTEGALSVTLLGPRLLTEGALIARRLLGPGLLRLSAAHRRAMGVHAAACLTGHGFGPRHGLPGGPLIPRARLLVLPVLIPVLVPHRAVRPGRAMGLHGAVIRRAAYVLFPVQRAVSLHLDPFLVFLFLTFRAKSGNTFDGIIARFARNVKIKRKGTVPIFCAKYPAAFDILTKRGYDAYDARNACHPDFTR